MVEGDMRSAINTLQFLKTKTSALTLDLVKQACVGQKDMQKSLYSVRSFLVN
jgi:DNA polymerase III delta prime subunit